MTHLRTALACLVVLVGVMIVTPLLAQDVLLIPESSNDGVLKFDPVSGAFLGYAVPPDPDHLSTPIDCALNSTGFLVSDQIDDAVQQYDLAGNWLSTFAAGIDNQRGIAAYDGALYCTGGNDDYIPYYDLQTGASLGDFIPSGGGGLDSPFDILFRTDDVLVASINTDNILRYALDGTPLGVFTSGLPFVEQMALAANGNVLATDFTDDVIYEFLPDGTQVGAYPGVSGPRGCYELTDGNLLTTNGSGVHVIARDGSGLITSWYSDVSARFIQAETLGATPVEPTTWGNIKAKFQN
ncbi:MAG: hypothetical protein PVF43_00085 [Candidatus Eiseniibacteriota bacterium]|jgi:hypothetical protein